MSVNPKFEDLLQFLRRIRQFLIIKKRGGEIMIGERLQELRKDHGMSQLELAQKLHVSFHTVSSYDGIGVCPMTKSS